MSRVCFPVFLLGLALGSVALGQDPVVPAKAAAATAPPDPLGWIKFVLDLGVPGVLSVGIYKLWGHYKDMQAEFLAKETAWVQEKADLKADCLKAKTEAEAAVTKEKADAQTAWALERTTLKDDYEEEAERAWAESRKDKTALRVSFEAEKVEMRAIYTTKIDQLQEKLEREQDARRVEQETLLREQNVLIREIMETAQAMAASLQENTRVVDKFNENNQT